MKNPSLSTLVIGVLLLWSGLALILIIALPSWSDRGQFGDLFGAANSLFSGLAFVGLFWALRIQSDQLALQQEQLAVQREELKLQREEMIASRGELANQVEAQRALFRASTAQIAVAAAHARIEAIKMNSEMKQPFARDEYVAQIEAIANALDSLSNRIESNHGAGSQETPLR